MCIAPLALFQPAKLGKKIHIGVICAIQSGRKNGIMPKIMSHIEESPLCLYGTKRGRVPVTVHLEDIAGKLEETMDHWEQYLNVVTGGIRSSS